MENIQILHFKKKNMEAILATTAYWICPLAQTVLFRIYFISGTFYRGKNKLASWKPYNNALMMGATTLWVLWLSTLVLSYMLLWLTFCMP